MNKDQMHIISIRVLRGVYMTEPWTNAGNEAGFTPTNRCFASETGRVQVQAGPAFWGAQLTLIRGSEGRKKKKREKA